MSQSIKDLFVIPGRTEQNPERLLILMEDLELTRQVADRLGPFYRLLFCLRFEKDLEPAEIAEIIGESRNYVNVYTCKLRKVIREKITR